MVAILFNGSELFGQIANILSTDGPIGKQVKIVQAVSEKKMFIDFMILYMYIADWQGQIIPKILTVANKQFYFFNHTL